MVTIKFSARAVGLVLPPLRSSLFPGAAPPGAATVVIGHRIARRLPSCVTSPSPTSPRPWSPRSIAPPSARFTEVATSLVRHLHEFVRETELTEAEWFAGHPVPDRDRPQVRRAPAGVHPAVGHAGRVDADRRHQPPQADRRHRGDGARAVLHAERADRTAAGPTSPTGSPACRPIFPAACARSTARRSRARWSMSGRPTATGFTTCSARGGAYARGKLTTDADGRYGFRTIKPVSYAIPTDGPVGVMLRAMGRHPYRPAHVHLIVSAPGYADGDDPPVRERRSLPRLRRRVRGQGVTDRRLRRPPPRPAPPTARPAPCRSAPRPTTSSWCGTGDRSHACAGPLTRQPYGLATSPRFAGRGAFPSPPLLACEERARVRSPVGLRPAIQSRPPCMSRVESLPEPARRRWRALTDWQRRARMAPSARRRSASEVGTTVAHLCRMRHSPRRRARRSSAHASRRRLGCGDAGAPARRRPRPPPSAPATSPWCCRGSIRRALRRADDRRSSPPSSAPRAALARSTSAWRSGSTADSVAKRGLRRQLRRDPDDRRRLRQCRRDHLHHRRCDADPQRRHHPGGRDPLDLRPLRRGGPLRQLQRAVADVEPPVGDRSAERRAADHPARR